MDGSWKNSRVGHEERSQREARRAQLVRSAIMAVIVVLAHSLTLKAEDPQTSSAKDNGALPGRSEIAEPAGPIDGGLQSSQAMELVEQQIEQLNHPSFRVRQVAKTVVERHPLAALEVIDKKIHQWDAVIGVQLVDLVSGLAMHADLAINSRATELLQRLANETTSVGRSATNALASIADLQEEQAREILLQHGAYIGPQNFSINGKDMRDLSPRLSLVIDDRFTGTEEDFRWIRFLKSIQVVYLRGKKIPAVAIESAAQLKQLRGLKLHSLNLTPEQLSLFQELRVLEQFGLSYIPVDDAIVPIILKLPITESIRLYGTKVTQQGRDAMARHFDRAEVFVGAGGFLGISSSNNSNIVSNVTPNSAADLAGLRSGDRILAVNNVNISNFDQLRTELGKREAGDAVDITFMRYFRGYDPQDIMTESITVQVVLQEES